MISNPGDGNCQMLDDKETSDSEDDLMTAFK